MTVGSLPAALTRDRIFARGTWLAALRLAGLGLQLGLAVLVIRAFDLEGPVFYRMFTVAAVGFLVGAVLPATYREAWFVLVSLAGIGLVFGVGDGLWLIAIGLGLIGICHLPLAWKARVALLVAVGGGLAFARAGGLQLPFGIGVWPILGSMFMFRLIVYLHHLKHNPRQVSAGRALAYFFMLPNVAFPLFPVVDYKTFDSTWKGQEAWDTYQAGLRYIARGLLHLVVYRYVYYYVARDPAELVNLGDLLTYVVSTYLLYIRVSGQFHIIIGILHLFGYGLPRANNNYYLATGFTEVWRRNNIYWKDFMMKLVYYPSFFKLRRHGQRLALALSMVAVFVLTWALHSYQWFWIRGDFPVTTVDLTFWGLLGGFMLVEMLRDSSRPAAARGAPVTGWSLSRAVRTVSFFFFFSCLWALWDSQSVGDFLSLWSLAGTVDQRTLVVAGLITVGALAIAGWPWTAPSLDDKAPQPWWRRSDVQTVAICLGLLGLTRPQVTNLAGISFTRFAQSLRETRLNARDAATQHRGYYANLNTNGGFVGGQMQEVNADRPADWVPLTETRVYRERPDFVAGELVPSTSLDFKGADFHTNRWGMRDRDYPKAKPAGTARIAVLGPSDVMGAGVADSETFEAVLEARLNREAAAGAPRVEVLNFAIVSHSLLQQMAIFTERAVGFDPDLVLVAFHPISEGRFAFQHLANMARYGIDIPYPELRAIVQEAGVKPGMRQAESFRRLKPYGDRLLVFALRTIATEARARGTEPFLMVRDLPSESSPPLQPVLDSAAALGYRVLDIRDVFTGHDPGQLLLASWDKHPNAAGHRLIADRLFREFTGPYAALLEGAKP